MGYVFAKKIIPVLVLCVVFLSGCKEPTMQVASLGKQLPKPVLNSSSPFDQDLESSGYIHFEGTCDSRLTDLSLSFDGNNWQSPPTQPDLSDTPITETLTNDFNCADGSYSFYLSAKDILQIWNLNVGPDSDADVNYIYIRGWSLIGYSESLAIKNDRFEDSIADRVVLVKEWPRGFAGSEQCEYFEARVQNARGDRASHKTPITFTIDKKIESTVTTGIAAFTSWEDCSSNTNSQTTFTIPADEDSLTVIYRFPASPIDTSFGFKLSNVSALSSSAEYLSVILRDSASATQRWISLQEVSHQIYKNQCVPFRLERMTYNKTPDSSTYADTIDLTTTDAALKFYSNSDCTAPSSSVTFASNSSLAEGYIKYESTETRNDLIRVDIQATSRVGNALTYDISPLRLNIDASSKNTLAKINSRTTASMANGQCYPVVLSPENGNGSLLAAVSDLLITLGTTQAGIGSFYASDACSTPISSTTIPEGALSSTVYFKPLVSIAGKYYLHFTSGAIVSTGHDIDITLAATKFKLFLGTILADSCVEVNIKLSDHLGNYYLANHYYGSTLSFTGIDYSALHSDPTCLVPTGTSFSIPAGSNQATFYINSQGLSGAPFSLQVLPVTGLEGDFFNGSF